MLTLDEVAELLAISITQAYSLVKTPGQLVGFQLGGRGIWRVRPSELEAFVGRLHEQTAAEISSKLVNPTA
jgi:hypothetical protein